MKSERREVKTLLPFLTGCQCKHTCSGCTNDERTFSSLFFGGIYGRGLEGYVCQQFRSQANSLRLYIPYDTKMYLHVYLFVLLVFLHVIRDLLVGMESVNGNNRHSLSILLFNYCTLRINCILRVGLPKYIIYVTDRKN